MAKKAGTVNAADPSLPKEVDVHNVRDPFRQFRRVLIYFCSKRLASHVIERASQQRAYTSERIVSIFDSFRLDSTHM